jgi:hypothetical protein
MKNDLHPTATQQVMDVKDVWYCWVIDSYRQLFIGDNFGVISVNWLSPQKNPLPLTKGQGAPSRAMF